MIIVLKKWVKLESNPKKLEEKFFMISKEVIKTIPMFSSLSDSEIADLGSSLRLMSLKNGQTLFHKGDEGTALYIVKRGRIKIVLSSSVGDEIIVTLFSDGEFFGEMAILDGDPRSADAIAIGATEVFVLRRNDFLSFLQHNKNAIQSVLSLLTRRLRTTDELLEDTCFLSISARLRKKLVELSKTYGREVADGVQLELSLTQKELGDMIGATRESINKELRILRQKDLISKDGNKIKLLDIERLKRRIF